MRKVWEIIALLEDQGWRYTRTKGDHHKFYKPGARRPIIIAGKRNDDLAEGTLKSILREAGINNNAQRHESTEGHD